MAALTSPIMRRSLTATAMAGLRCGCGHATINMARPAPAAGAGTVHVLTGVDTPETGIFPSDAGPVS